VRAVEVDIVVGSKIGVDGDPHQAGLARKVILAEMSRHVVRVP